MQEQPFTIRRLIAAQQGMLPAALWPQRTRRHLCLGGQPRRHSAAERVLHELPERGERARATIRPPPSRPLAPAASLPAA